jgi:integrase
MIPASPRHARRQPRPILLDEGKNPLDERRAAMAPKVAIPTFGEFADALVKDQAKAFRSEKHAAQWAYTLGPAYCAVIRPKRIDRIGVDDVLAVLQPVWTIRPETASRVRARIEHALDAAKVKGLREGENPARWRGHLDKLLSKRAKLSRGHQAAMPYADVPAFVQSLRQREAVAARCLEYLILTAARSGEARGATWDEIDLAAKVWTIPAERMKMADPHRVPLTAGIVAILEEVGQLTGREGLIFPGAKRGRPLSDAVFGALFERMGVTGITVHGFRSSFRDWCGDATSFPRELAEAALAHKVGSAVEAAYRRGDALERRRKVMVAWDRFVGGQSAGVVAMRTVKGKAA